jgi:tRNA-dihydrouridine synthase C
MEGLADAVMRDLLTRGGGFDGCVSEFIRVTSSVLPPRVYEREAPEVMHNARTRSGTPMVVQLLGSDPAWMARNAAQAAALSPWGVDLNFGCPAKIVNQHGGGAMLLTDPEKLYRIVSAVRAAVPTGIAVTAKMRLGVSDTSRAIDCAIALAEGGAGSIVVHARTRDEGYKAPAHWEWIARIDAELDGLNNEGNEAQHVIATAIADTRAIDPSAAPSTHRNEKPTAKTTYKTIAKTTDKTKVIANGEVWTVADWAQCRAVSGCVDVMLGRGAIADPFLAQRIRGEMPRTASAAEWPLVLHLMLDYMRVLQTRALPQPEPAHEHGRLKKWLSYLQLTWPEAAALHSAIRRMQNAAEVIDVLQLALKFQSAGALPETGTPAVSH